MDLIDKVRELSSRIPKQIDHIETEEATKNAFIMPFLNALGYDIFDPREVVPEFTADVGNKKGEKVDYAIKKDNQVVMLVECKWCGADLHSDHTNQLYRYFSVSEARFAILTNGLVYEFYSDIDEPNKMDSHPFFSFDILHFQEHQIKELKQFTKSAFTLDQILDRASTLKYTKGVKKILEQEVANPSKDFVKFFAAQILVGRKLTQNLLDEFAPIVQEAHKQFVNEKISSRLQSALNDTEPVPVSLQSVDESSEESTPSLEENGIVTTEEEIEAYHIVKAILRDTVSADRVAMRDTKSYCGILLDDNNRRPICRLHFNYSQKYIGLFAQKQEEKLPINDLHDIFNYADKIKAVIGDYDNNWCE